MDCWKLMREFTEFPEIILKREDDVKVTFGRVQVAQADIICESRFVSRQHCSISFRSGVFYVRDLKSTNGTFLNGVKIRPQLERELRLGDKIGVGIGEMTECPSLEYFMFRLAKDTYQNVAPVPLPPPSLVNPKAIPTVIAEIDLGSSSDDLTGDEFEPVKVTTQNTQIRADIPVPAPPRIPPPALPRIPPPAPIISIPRPTVEPVPQLVPEPNIFPETQNKEVVVHDDQRPSTSRILKQEMLSLKRTKTKRKGQIISSSGDDSSDGLSTKSTSTVGTKVKKERPDDRKNEHRLNIELEAVDQMGQSNCGSTGRAQWNEINNMTGRTSAAKSVSEISEDERVNQLVNQRIVEWKNEFTDELAKFKQRLDEKEAKLESLESLLKQTAVEYSKGKESEIKRKDEDEAVKDLVVKENERKRKHGTQEVDMEKESEKKRRLETHKHHKEKAPEKRVPSDSVKKLKNKEPAKNLEGESRASTDRVNTNGNKVTEVLEEPNVMGGESMKADKKEIKDHLNPKSESEPPINIPLPTLPVNIKEENKTSKELRKPESNISESNHNAKEVEKILETSNSTSSRVTELCKVPTMDYQTENCSEPCENYGYDSKQDEIRNVMKSSNNYLPNICLQPIITNDTDGRIVVRIPENEDINSASINKVIAHYKQFKHKEYQKVWGKGVRESKSKSASTLDVSNETTSNKSSRQRQEYRKSQSSHKTTVSLPGSKIDKTVPTPTAKSTAPIQPPPNPNLTEPIQSLPNPNLTEPIQSLPNPNLTEPIQSLPNPNLTEPIQPPPKPNMTAPIQPPSKPNSTAPIQHPPKPKSTAPIQPPSKPNSAAPIQPPPKQNSTAPIQHPSKPKSTPPKPNSAAPIQPPPKPNSTAPIQPPPKPNSTVPIQPPPKPNSTAPIQPPPKPNSTVPIQLPPKPNSTAPIQPPPKPNSTVPIQPPPKQNSTAPIQPPPKPNSTAPTQPPPKPNLTASIQPPPKPNSTAPIQPPPKPNSTAPTQPPPKPNSIAPIQPPPKPNSTAPIQPPPKTNLTASIQPPPKPNSTAPIQPPPKTNLTASIQPPPKPNSTAPIQPPSKQKSIAPTQPPPKTKLTIPTEPQPPQPERSSITNDEPWRKPFGPKFSAKLAEKSNPEETNHQSTSTTKNLDEVKDRIRNKEVPTKQLVPLNHSPAPRKLRGQEAPRPLMAYSYTQTSHYSSHASTSTIQQEENRATADRKLRLKEVAEAEAAKAKEDAAAKPKVNAPLRVYRSRTSKLDALIGSLQSSATESTEVEKGPSSTGVISVNHNTMTTLTSSDVQRQIVNSRSDFRHLLSRRTSTTTMSANSFNKLAEDQLFRDILNWNPEWLQDAKPSHDLVPHIYKLMNNPSEFRDYDLYVNTFYPLMLHELWKTIYDDFQKYRKQKRNNFEIGIESHGKDSFCPMLLKEKNSQTRNPESEWYWIKLVGLVEKDEANPNDFGLISVTVKDKIGFIKPKTLIGFFLRETEKYEEIISSTVLHTELVTRNGNDLSKLKFSINFLTKLESDSLVFERVGYMQRFARTSPMVQSFLALSTLFKTTLFEKILYPSPKSPITQINAFNINKDIQIPLEGNQRKIVQQLVLRILLQNSPDLDFVYGPPGTGKTQTIIGLVLQLLKSTTLNDEGRPRLLLCSPSEFSLDQLILRLSPFLSHLKLVRVGESGEEVKKFTILSIAKSRCKTGCSSSVMTREDILRDIILESDIVFATLQSCVDPIIKKYFGGETSQQRFNCCIVDDAAQCTEPESLLPTLLNCNKLVLFGDPIHQRGVVRSKEARDRNYHRSLFSRHYDFHEKNEHPIMELDIQFRMNEDILRWPNSKFYEGSSMTLTDKATRLEKLLPYVFLDVRISSSEKKSSRTVTKEVEIVRAILNEIRTTAIVNSIGIISSNPEHKQELVELVDELKNDLYKFWKLIEVGTIDEFQGKEKDVIIFFCIRNETQLLTDEQLIIGLTRARVSLYIVGNGLSLKQEPIWKDLLDDALRRKVYKPIGEADMSDPIKAIKRCIHTQIS